MRYGDDAADRCRRRPARNRAIGPNSQVFRPQPANGLTILLVGGLIERAAEVSAVQELVAGAVDGAGGTLLFAGRAGIGKSSLLTHATEVARALGVRVLSSFPTPVSTGLSHGVVRDWLGPLARTAIAGESPFDGPAAPLADALSAPVTTDHDVWNIAALDYALTWTVESLSGEQPLLLLVDDLQWADLGSLQLLDLLAARLHQLPVALLLGLRTGEPMVGREVVDRLVRRARVLEPAPLSLLGVEQLRRRATRTRLPSSVSTRDLLELTGGVPFLLQELLRSDRPDRAPRGVVSSVRDRLGRLGQTALEVARMVAVLGDEAGFDTLAELTGLTAAELADPLELLTDADIVGLGMWRAWPAHPLVAEAILTSMTASERSALHARAAAHLAALGRPRQVVASHLIHTVPGGDPAVVELLRAAGEESLDAGAPDVAAKQLLRAAGETPPDQTDPSLLATAAMAHLRADLNVEAFSLWERALAGMVAPEDRALCLADVGDARMNAGQRALAHACYREAVTLLEHAGHGTSSPALRGLVARMAVAQVMYDGAHDVLEGTLADTLAQPPEEDTPADRLLLSVAASTAAARGEDHLQAAALARRALGAGRLLAEEGSEGIGVYTATSVLSFADAFDEALQVLDAAIDESRRRGSSLGFTTASYCRGSVRLRKGHLRDALSDFDAALKAREHDRATQVGPAMVGSVVGLVAIGAHEQALALEPALREAAATHDLLGARAVVAAGLVRASHGDHEQALADFRHAGRLLSPHVENPSIIEWRERSAWSLVGLGRREEAAEVAAEALERARRWGAPRAVGLALHTLAVTSPAAEAVPLLREAVAQLDAAGAVDLRARAGLELGALLVKATAEDRTEGVRLLREALDYARTTDVPPVQRRAVRLLVRAGEPVTERGESPVGALTPGERRVVELAAAGDTNRQIAQKLFVTVKAVEWHLSNAYRKLGVSSRAQLPDVLSGEGPSSSSAR